MPPSPPSDSGGEEPPIDDFIAPDDEFRPPLPPEDRIWRHPSEVAAAARLQSSPPPPPTPGRVSVATVAVSALIGATLSLGAVAALGGFHDRVVERRVAVDMAAQEGAGTGTHAAVGMAAPSVAGVSVRHGDEWSAANATILRSDGHLLTAAGPLEGADDVEVHLSDGDSFEAEVVGVDATTDVAVIRIDSADLTPAVIGSSGHLDVGDDALTVGLVAGTSWEQVLTTCVVRAVGQRAHGDHDTFHDVVLLDAEVPDQTAGAPVVDRRGAVIGILASPGVSAASGGSVVIPIDDAVHIADEILEFGRARHVWLGIGGHDLARDEAKALQLDGGAAVSSVFPDSPAATSGLEVGDVIVAVDGVEIASMSDLVVELRRHDPGEGVELSVARDGRVATVSSQLAERAGS